MVIGGAIKHDEATELSLPKWCLKVDVNLSAAEAGLFGWRRKKWPHRS